MQLELAQRLREVTNGKALLFVNDSVSIAEASRADGVQLTENSRSIASARARMARPLLVGRSVHGVDAAREAAAQGADLLVVGTVYDSPTHPGQPPAGVGLVGWCAQTGVPVLGIGGITAESASAVMQAGASGVAVISTILGSDDPARRRRSNSPPLSARPSLLLDPLSLQVERWCVMLSKAQPSRSISHPWAGLWIV